MSDKYRMSEGHLQNILLALKENEKPGCTIRGYIDNQKTAVIAYGDNDYYIWDNGGEIGVEVINSSEQYNIPMTRYSTPLNALTVAYRIKQILDNKEIDYDFEHSDEKSEIFLKCFNREERMFEHFSVKNCEVYDEEDDDEEEM